MERSGIRCTCRIALIGILAGVATNIQEIRQLFSHEATIDADVSLKAMSEKDIAALLDEVKKHIDDFKGASDALSEQPNYQDAMNACAENRRVFLKLYLLRQNEGNLPSEYMSNTEEAFKKTLSTLQDNPDILNSVDLYNSTRRRYEYFKKLRDKGPSAITPRMLEEADKL